MFDIVSDIKIFINRFLENVLNVNFFNNIFAKFYYKVLIPTWLIYIYDGIKLSS